MTQKQIFKIFIVVFVVATFCIVVVRVIQEKKILPNYRASADEKPNLQVVNVARSDLPREIWRDYENEFGGEFLQEISVYQYTVKNTGSASTKATFWSILYGVEHDNPNVRCDSSFLGGLQSIGLLQLKPRETHTFIVPIHCPSRNPPGKTITALVDVRNDIAESNEKDNGLMWFDTSR